MPPADVNRLPEGAEAMRFSPTWSARSPVSGVGAMLVAGAPLIGAVGLLFASPVQANPAMCAVEPSVYQSSGVCQTQQPIGGATKAGQSSSLPANPTGPAPAGNANSLPQTNGMPCTGLNTGMCIGLQLTTPTAG